MANLFSKQAVFIYRKTKRSIQRWVFQYLFLQCSKERKQSHRCTHTSVLPNATWWNDDKNVWHHENQFINGSFTYSKIHISSGQLTWTDTNAHILISLQSLSHMPVGTLYRYMSLYFASDTSVCLWKDCIKDNSLQMYKLHFIIQTKTRTKTNDHTSNLPLGDFTALHKHTNIFPPWQANRVSL